MTGDDHALARHLAGQAGRRLTGLRARGGDPGVLRKAGDRLSHEFLVAALAERQDLPFFVDRSADATETLITEGLDAAQNIYHADQPGELPR